MATQPKGVAVPADVKLREMAQYCREVGKELRRRATRLDDTADTIDKVAKASAATREA